jgi:hypothetical protein
MRYRIQDWTIYITSALFVAIVGTLDEFIQWLMPSRFWDYRDVGINLLAGVIFLLAIWKGIKPQIISGTVRKFSVNMLAGIITFKLIFLGLCLSNTPDNVHRYTTAIKPLAWLQTEEPMTEYGYKHKDPEIGYFYSRLSLSELKNIDLNSGETYGNIVLEKIKSGIDSEELTETYTPGNNPFLYEFLVHVSRRDKALSKLLETDELDSKVEAFKENLLLERYFGNTLKHANLKWTDKELSHLRDEDLLKIEYLSKVGTLITFFSIKTVWVLTFFLLFFIWTFAQIWKKRLYD